MEITDKQIIERKNTRWSKEEENTLRFLYVNRKLCIHKISSIIKRTQPSIVSKLRLLEITDHYYKARGFTKLLNSYKKKGRTKFADKVKLDKKNAKIQKKR
jgi:hypothetical protein